MNSESYIVTKNMDFVPFNELNQYVVKESKALIEETEEGYDGLVNPPYNPQDLLRLLDINTWHRRCCDVIANDVAGAGYNILSINEDTEPNQFLVDFFKNINELIYKVEFDAEAIGYGLVEVIRENGRDSPVKELKHFPSTTFVRHNDGVRVKQTVGTKHRWFIILGENIDEDGKPYDVHVDTGEISYTRLPENERANELLWINRYTPLSSLYGASPVLSALSSVYGDYHQARYNSSFFKNYGLPSFAVKITGDFDPGITDTDDPDYDVNNLLKTKIQTALKGVIENPHSAMVIEVPSEGAEGNVTVDIQPLSVDNKEASFVVYRKNNRDEIIGAHGVDPNRLSISENGQLNGSNSEQLDSAYRTSVITPYRRQIIDLINSRVINEALGIIDYKLEILDNDTSNVKDDVDNILRLVQNAIITINEARDYLGAAFNIQPKEDISLDEHYYNGKAITSAGFDNNLFDNNLFDVVDDTYEQEEDIGRDG